MTNIPNDLVDLIKELVAIDEKKKLQDKIEEILYEELRAPLEELPSPPNKDKSTKIEISLE